MNKYEKRANVMTDGELIIELKDTQHMIYVINLYGLEDARHHDAAKAELRERGYKLVHNPPLIEAVKE